MLLMARSRSKRNRAAPPSDPKETEGRAREFLERGKWRKARDLIKPLFKTNHERYKPLLIEANIGLGREMLAKGLVKEAEQVVEYLADIASPAQIAALKIEVQTASGDDAAVDASEILKALNDPNAEVPEGDRIRLADQTMLASQVEEEGAETSGSQAEVAAIWRALLAVTQSDWEAVATQLRKVPRRSAFSHWALFAKGLAALYSSDTTKAARCFDGLPKESVPGRAGRVFGLIAGTSPLDARNPALPEVAALCQLVSAAIKPERLREANGAWARGQLPRAYKLLQDCCASFPSCDSNLEGALSEFFFHAPFSISETDRDKLSSFFDDRMMRRKWRSACEEFLMRRMFVLIDHPCMPEPNLRNGWGRVLELHETIHGPNPRLASAGYAWLGKQLAEPIRSFFSWGRQEERMRDAAGAIEALQSSIDLDPENLGAHLDLCRVYDGLKQHSERNRLLDKMSERFPNEKQVLLWAAEQCVRRKAFTKGMKYLDRAREIDPLDPEIARFSRDAHRQWALNYFRKGQPEKARQALAPVDKTLTDSTEDLERCRWAELIRRGIMESQWGDRDQSKGLLDEAQTRAPFLSAFLFFAHLTERHYSKKSRNFSKFLAALHKTARKQPTLAQSLVLLGILEHWQSQPKSPRLLGEQQILAGTIEAAHEQPFALEEGVEIIERTRGLYLANRPLAMIIHKALKKDPAHPRFRLYLIDPDWFPSLDDGPVDVDELKDIIAEADRRHDEVALRRAQALLRSVERAAEMTPPYLPVFDPFEDDEVDDDFDADDPDAWNEPAESLQTSGAGAEDPEYSEEVEELLSLLKKASPQEINELRRLWSERLPEGFFDKLLDAARPSEVPPRPRAPQPEPDPNQLDLF